jgi:hypothetical protein
MTRWLALAAAAALIAPLAAAARPPARSQVVAREFAFTLSRASIRHGTAIVELVNFGEDDHDLALRRIGGGRTYRTGVVHPGRVGELALRLPPGRYRLWCTLAGHRARGMLATLRVN